MISKHLNRNTGIILSHVWKEHDKGKDAEAVQRIITLLQHVENKTPILTRVVNNQSVLGKLKSCKNVTEEEPNHYLDDNVTNSYPKILNFVRSNNIDTILICGFHYHHCLDVVETCLKKIDNVDFYFIRECVNGLDHNNLSIDCVNNFVKDEKFITFKQLPEFIDCTEIPSRES